MTRVTQGARCHAQSRVGTLWLLGLLLAPDPYPADSGVQTTDRCSSASCRGVGRMLATGCPKERVGSTRRGCQRRPALSHEAGGGDELLVPARASPSMQAGPSRGSAATQRSQHQELESRPSFPSVRTTSQCCVRGLDIRRGFPIACILLSKKETRADPHKCFFNLTVKRVFSHNLR